MSLTHIKLSSAPMLVGCWAVSMAVVGIFGCDAGISLDRSDDWSYFQGWDPAALGEPLETGEAQISGNFGESALQDPALATVEAWHSAGFWGVEMSTVDVRAADSDGWISMGMMEVYGGLGGGELEPGSVRRFDITDDSPGLFVVFTGCSGLNPDDWSHDDLAQTVTLSVDPELTADGLRTIRFDAEFARGDWLSPNYSPSTTTLSGSFQVRPIAPLN